MDTVTDARLAPTQRHPCRNCGSEMQFDPASQALRCPSCGSTEAIATATDRIVETDFDRTAAVGDAATGLDLPAHSYHCTNCGAVTVVELTQVAVQCSFCSSTSINEQAFDQRTVRPYGLIPFRIVAKAAQQRFAQWIGRGWFHPNGLKRLAELKALHGVYVPFWTFDADTYSRWQAEAGYYYYVNVQYTDSEGRTQTRQEQRVRWEYVSGTYDYHFDDVTVVASKGLQQGMAERVFPYTLASAVNYDPKFLLGFQSEVYAVDAAGGFSKASDIMDRHLYHEIASRVPGDTHRNLDIDTEKSAITYKHLLLPMWIAAYVFGGKTYQVVVNGETGAISGEKPLSWVKVALAVLLVLAVVAVVLYLQRGS